MAKHGKSFTEALAQVDREREYAPAEAIELVKQLKRAKFDESIEVHIRTGLNVRQAVVLLRGTIGLPFFMGKEL
jgi:large subunit ribosomal protein L1